jgi:hypothetical protein
MSWICGKCRWQNFTTTTPCVHCGAGVVDSRTPVWFPRDIIAPVGDRETEAVRIAQRALRLQPTGNMDEPTKASLRGAQRLYGLPVSGILDAATAIVIDRLRPWVIEEEERPCRPY